MALRTADLPWLPERRLSRPGRRDGRDRLHHLSAALPAAPRARRGARAGRAADRLDDRADLHGDHVAPASLQPALSQHRTLVPLPLSQWPAADDLAAAANDPALGQYSRRVDHGSWHAGALYRGRMAQ